jgi:hypothetical protein
MKGQRSSFAAKARPAADLRPSTSGLVVNMRYITRGPLRYEAKSHGAEKVTSV